MENEQVINDGVVNVIPLEAQPEPWPEIQPEIQPEVKPEEPKVEPENATNN
jgi:hypothetical protein